MVSLNLMNNVSKYFLTLSQTTNLRLFQTERDSRRQFQIWWNKQFFLFSQCFQKTCTADTWKQGLVWERVKTTKYCLYSSLSLPFFLFVQHWSCVGCFLAKHSIIQALWKWNPGKHDLWWWKLERLLWTMMHVHHNTHYPLTTLSLGMLKF